MSAGPLAGVKVVEVGGIGPGPFAGMILADLGAEVVRIDRPGGSLPLPMPTAEDLANRGKTMISLDLKRPAAIEALLAVVARSDLLIEGFRPGVAERLGFGPDVCFEQNPALVYGRMTGWGQDGPWSTTAGHDLNYVAMAGALHAIGPADGPPSIPLNLLGDYGGGSTYLVMGLLAGLWSAGRSGRGQVVDAAIVDGVAHLMAGVHGFVNSGLWTDRRGANVLDGAAPFYRLYETSDGRHVAVGGIEPAFFQEMCRLLGVSISTQEQNDPAAWPQIESTLADTFSQQPMDHWARLFDGSDACVTPVPSVLEAPTSDHLRKRGTFVLDDDRLAPAPAPRFSGTPTARPTRPTPPGTDTRDLLESLGLDADALIASGAAYQIDTEGEGS